MVCTLPPTSRCSLHACSAPDTLPGSRFNPLPSRKGGGETAFGQAKEVTRLKEASSETEQNQEERTRLEMGNIPAPAAPGEAADWEVHSPAVKTQLRRSCQGGSALCICTLLPNCKEQEELGAVTATLSISSSALRPTAAFGTYASRPRQCYAVLEMNAV